MKHEKVLLFTGVIPAADVVAKKLNCNERFVMFQAYRDFKHFEGCVES